MNCTRVPLTVGNVVLGLVKDLKLIPLEEKYRWWRPQHAAPQLAALTSSLLMSDRGRGFGCSGSGIRPDMIGKTSWLFGHSNPIINQ